MKDTEKGWQSEVLDNSSASFAFHVDDVKWTYPVRILALGRVFEIASEGAMPVDITDELPPAEPCQECDVCDNPEAWKD